MLKLFNKIILCILSLFIVTMANATGATQTCPSPAEVYSNFKWKLPPPSGWKINSYDSGKVTKPVFGGAVAIALGNNVTQVNCSYASEKSHYGIYAALRISKQVTNFAATGSGWTLKGTQHVCNRLNGVANCSFSGTGS